jgi:transcriptional regulator with XRE-family HTH domain
MRLTEERLRRNWSRAELARRAGLNATTVSLIESGRLLPYEAQLEKLARALGWPAGEAARLLEVRLGESTALDPTGTAAIGARALESVAGPAVKGQER